MQTCLGGNGFSLTRRTARCAEVYPTALAPPPQRMLFKRACSVISTRPLLRIPVDTLEIFRLKSLHGFTVRRQNFSIHDFSSFVVQLQPMLPCATTFYPHVLLRHFPLSNSLCHPLTQTRLSLVEKIVFVYTVFLRSLSFHEGTYLSTSRLGSCSSSWLLQSSL